MFESVEKLTAAMAAGNARAVEAFYRKYFQWIYRTAQKTTGRDESFCLDVVQDAMLRLIRTVRKVDSEAQLFAWLRLVVQTTAFDLLKAESRRRRREMAVAVGIGAEVEAASEGDDRLACLARQIARLDPEIVKIIEMRFHARWTLGRIAQAMGLSVGTVDGRLRRALRQIRILAELELNDD
jgi:RNA polymerase sigma factor (sigma-70 family)